MLRDNFHAPAKLVTYGFLIAMEAEDGICDIDLIKDRLAGACTWMEGVGRTEVNYIGVIPEEESGEET